MFTGLKRRFIGLIILTCIVTGTGSVIAFFLVMDNTVRDLRKAYATQYTLLEKGRILAPIQREVALTMKMVDSPVLKAWALDENNPILKAQALKELESYRRHFQDQSWFFIIDPSKHFYFNSSSSKILMNLFDMLNRAAIEGTPVTINWRYHEDNDVALECGEEFMEDLDLTNLTFNLVVIMEGA